MSDELIEMNGFRDGEGLGMIHTPVDYKAGENVRVIRAPRANLGQNILPFPLNLPGGGASFLDPSQISDKGARVAAALQNAKAFLARVDRLPEPWRTEVPRLMQAYDQLITIVREWEKSLRNNDITQTDLNWIDRWNKGLRADGGGFEKMVSDIEAGKFRDVKTVVDTRLVEVERENLLKTVAIGAGIAGAIGLIAWAAGAFN